MTHLAPDVEDLPALALTGWEGLSRREREESWQWFCARAEDGEITKQSDQPGPLYAWDLKERSWRTLEDLSPAHAHPRALERALDLAQAAETIRATLTHDVAPQSTLDPDAFPVQPGQISLVEPKHGLPVCNAMRLNNVMLEFQRSVKLWWRVHVLAAGGETPPLNLERAKWFSPPISGPVWPLPSGSKDCSTGRWTTLLCQNGHRQRHFTGCCTRRCGNCAGWVGKRRARRSWKKCLGGTRERLGVVVLTVPPELRGHLFRPGLLRKWWRRMWGVVEEWGAVAWGQVRLGGAGWFHPTGSVNVCHVCHRRERRGGQAEDGSDFIAADAARWCCDRPMTTADDDRWHPHFNIVFPLEGLQQGGRALRYKVSDEALHALKVALRRALVELCDEDADEQPSGARYFAERPGLVPVAHYSWRGDDNENSDYIAKSHSLRYFARAFPTWGDWTSHTRWFGAANPYHWKRTKETLVAEGRWREPPMGLCAECGMRLFLVDISNIHAWDGHHAHPLRAGGAQVSTCGPPQRELQQ